MHNVSTEPLRGFDVKLSPKKRLNFELGVVIVNRKTRDLTYGNYIGLVS